MIALRQWDVVKVRINADDRDEHPAVVLSADEFCAAETRTKVNVLYGTTKRPGVIAAGYEVILNGADGLERSTLFNCAHLYTVDRRRISASLGRVTAERRRQIGRKIIATFRLPM